MWKLIVGFIAFAALALYILTKSVGNIDLSGEKHDVAAHEPSASEVAAAGAAASAAVTAASAAVEAASGPASAASQ